MATPPIDARALAQSGAEALRRGDARTARETFERIVAARQADASVCMALAYACRRLRDVPAALAAVEKALALTPHDVRTLILKADLLADSGDERSASSFYQFAIRIAPPSNEMPADLRDELTRAQAMCNRYAGQFEAFLQDRLRRLQIPDGRAVTRFKHSLDILLGRKKIYHQQPRVFHYPELPQVQFYDASLFPWIDKVEAATADIRSELTAVLEESSAFVPYVNNVPGRPVRDLAGLAGNPDWSAFYLWKDGELQAANAERCPKTMAAMEAVPLTRTENRSPSVLFSLLRPGAHIPPHAGLVNTRLICHLPLIVPPDCEFRVGNDTRTPVEGKVWIFDDTMEHEAWNRSDRTRVILIFEVWRPELSEEERQLVTAMFEAIDAYSGQKPTWSI